MNSTFKWRNQPSKTGAALMRGIAQPAKAPLLASLDVPQRTFLVHAQPVKQQPGYGVFGSV